MKSENIKFRGYWKGVNAMAYFDNGIFDWSKEGYVGMFLRATDDKVYMGQCEITQFIGLKDRHGVDIYEGDIVNDQSDGRDRLVKWSSQNASFYLSSTKGGVSFYKEFTQCGQSQSDGPVHLDNIEVVGNIYEHPDLYNKEENAQRTEPRTERRNEV